jgi:hypothetical protein
MTDDIKLPPLPRLQVPRIEADVSLIDIKVLAQWCERTATAYARAAVLADREERQQDKLDAARWRYIRRKLCLIGNGDGTCAMQAINLPAAIQGWPEPEQVAEFYDAAIDAAMREEGKQ